MDALFIFLIVAAGVLFLIWEFYKRVARAMRLFGSLTQSALDKRTRDAIRQDPKILKDLMESALEQSKMKRDVRQKPLPLPNQPQPARQQHRHLTADAIKDHLNQSSLSAEVKSLLNYNRKKGDL